ncbi:MAG: DNA gyrase inhibitor YacG [Alphaproteobacteria bacterium]|nr:DNA gyrase inhibitor YacG [Alphaproteobacteria bacterium]
MNGPRCPVCGKPMDVKLKPFCSRRCADRDLNRWLSEGYAIPAEEQPANDLQEADPGLDRLTERPEPL